MSVHPAKLFCANFYLLIYNTFSVFYQLSKNDFISTRLTLDMTSTSLPKCWRRYAYLSSTYGFRLGIPSFSNLSSTTVRQYSVKAFVLRLHVVFIVTRVLRLIGRGRSSALFQVLAHKVIIIAKKYASHFVSGNYFQYCTESVQFEVFSNMYYSRNFQASKHSLFLV